jgi:hypothetical protein
MNKMVDLFDEFIIKAITLTEEMLNLDYSNGQKLEQFTQNRERIMSIIDQISKEIDWATVEIEVRRELNRKIDYIKSLDVKLVTKLQIHQEEVKQEIEQTFKQKENIKGYNLSDVK